MVNGWLQVRYIEGENRQSAVDNFLVIVVIIVVLGLASPVPPKLFFGLFLLFWFHDISIEKYN